MLFFKARDIICTAKQNVSTCSRLINNTFLLIVTLISGLFIALLNVLISLQYFMKGYMQQTEKTVAYKTLAVVINLSNLLLGINFLILVIYDTLKRDSFILQDMHWRQSKTCLAMAESFYISQMFSCLQTIALTAFRYINVKHPLKNIISLKTTKLVIIINFIFSFGMVLTLLLWNIYSGD